MLLMLCGCSYSHLFTGGLLFSHAIDDF